MDAVVDVTEVETHSTRSGAVRYVVRASDGREFTTFREEIGRQAERLRGTRAQVAFHEAQHGRFTNVYLDAISAVSSAGGDGPPPDPDGNDTEAVAWNAAIEAAPWLVGSSEPKAPVEPEQLFERLRGFKELVADDIRDGPDEQG